jgi:deoxyribonuclease V
MTTARDQWHHARRPPSAVIAASSSRLSRSFSGTPHERVAAALVVLETDSLETVDEVTVVGRARFDHMPGLLSFREMPVLLDALARSRHEPDLIVCDGHGYAHPRRAGLACQLGQWTDIATSAEPSSR